MRLPKEIARKRVLFVDHVSRILGGAEVNLVELLDTVAARRQWEVACACPPGSPLSLALLSRAVRQFGHGYSRDLNQLRVVGRPFRPLAHWRGWKELERGRERLREIVGEFQPAIVVSCTNKDHLCAAPLCHQRGTPSVWWVNDIVSADFFGWAARRAFCSCARRHARRLVVVSDFARQALLWQKIPPGRVTVIRNGIPFAAYQPRRRGALRGVLPVSPAQPLVGMVGRLAPWKGQDFFLRLAEAWANAGLVGHFVLLGSAFNEDEPYEAALRRFVSAQGLDARVHFVPFKGEVAEALTDLDVLVHASLKPEPFGRVIVEGMAAGLPVIAARDGGVPEIVTHGVNGLLAKPGDLGAYLEALREILGSPETAQRLAAAARNTVRERFTVERVQAQFEQVFAEVISGPA